MSIIQPGAARYLRHSFYPALQPHNGSSVLCIYASSHLAPADLSYFPRRDWALTAVGRADRPLTPPDQPGVSCKMPSTVHHGRSPAVGFCSATPADAALAPGLSYCFCIFGRAYHSSRLTPHTFSKARRLPTLGRTADVVDHLQLSPRRVRRSDPQSRGRRLLIFWRRTQ